MKASFRTLAALCLGLLPTACADLNLYSEQEEIQLGAAAYDDATSEYPIIRGTQQDRMLQEVGHRIAQASGKDYEWEFRLLDADKVPNAFCLPGGKVAVYTGILPYTQDADGLAAVLGHEVAHATLRHGGKRMTQHNMTQIALAAIGAGLAYTDMSDGAKEGLMLAFGVGATVGYQLPYSRQHETEADEVGVRYAIRAGYDPYAAVQLWERMAAAGGGSQPEWLSTHPDSLARARNLEQKIPQILAEEGR